MADLILHHYPASPFSEKVRRILALKGLPWRSVIVPSVLPKPDLLPLTGGYRRTPVLQIGADIYCDSSLIALKLDQLAPQPPLFPRALASTVAMVARWSDSALFSHAVTLLFQPAVLDRLFGDAVAARQRFVDDRTALFKESGIRRSTVPEARSSLAVHLAELDAQLEDGRSFLFGDAPTIADFSTYHPLWLLRRTPGLGTLLDPYRRLGGWMARVASLQGAAGIEISSQSALDIARRASPAPIAPQSAADGVAPGDVVDVLPVDYGRDPVRGQLLACTHERIAIRRRDAAVGEVVVHFPRLNYEIRLAPAARQHPGVR